MSTDLGRGATGHERHPHNRSGRRARSVVLAVVAILGACHDASKPSVSAVTTTPIVADTSCMALQVGPAGGTLTHATGAQMVVPVGALATENTLTLCGIKPPSADKLGGTPLAQGVEA